MSELPTPEPQTPEIGKKQAELRPQDTACNIPQLKTWITEERAKETAEAHGDADALLRECIKLRDAQSSTHNMRSNVDFMKRDTNKN